MKMISNCILQLSAELGILKRYFYTVQNMTVFIDPLEIKYLSEMHGYIPLLHDIRMAMRVVSEGLSFVLLVVSGNQSASRWSWEVYV